MATCSRICWECGNPPTKIQVRFKPIEYFLTSSEAGGDWASPIPRPMATAAVQARAKVFIVLKVYFASFS